MKRTLSRFTSLLTILVISFLFTGSTVQAAAFNFNSYEKLADYAGPNYYGDMQGLTIDRVNNRAFFAKINNHINVSQLICYDLTTNTTIACIDTGANSSSIRLTYAPDMYAVADGTSTILYVAIGSPLEPSIIKLRITASGEVTKENYYTFSFNGKQPSIYDITYDEENQVFIIGIAGQFFVGNFNDSTHTFDSKGSFKFDYKKVSFNGQSPVSCNMWSRGNITYHKGTLYHVVCPGKPDLDTSAIVASRLDSKMIMETSTNDAPAIITPREDGCIRIKSFYYSKGFEITGIDFDKDGAMYFNANGKTYKSIFTDLLGKVKNYNVNDYAFN